MYVSLQSEQPLMIIRIGKTMQRYKSFGKDARKKDKNVWNKNFAM